MKLFDLKGAAALVTGAGRGLGLGIARGLAGAGCNVLLVARTQHEIAAAAGELRTLGIKAHYLVADTHQISRLKDLITGCVERFGRLDVLVPAAGYNLRSPALDFSEEAWDEVLNVQLKSIFFLCQAAARQMLGQEPLRSGSRGKIVLVTSLASVIGLPRIPAYASAKGGISALTRNLAREWALEGIQVNEIGPGYFETEMTRGLFADPEWRAWCLSRIPMGRSGLPEDLAGTAVFLASAASDYVTGQTIFVDGGWLVG